MTANGRSVDLPRLASYGIEPRVKNARPWAATAGAPISTQRRRRQAWFSSFVRPECEAVLGRDDDAV
jgi:hypothetical protein